MLSMAACGSNTTQTAELTDEQCIGTWEWVYEQSIGNSWGVETMELYKGGTGKGYNSLLTGDSHYPLSWEISNDILKVSFTADPLSCAFEMDGDTITSTDGEIVYIKQG